MPLPRVPDDNPMTAEKVELGHHLFYEQRLSVNSIVACSSCHQPRHAFAGSVATPVGTTGQATARNALSLANAAYIAHLTWQDPALTRLEQQVLVPMLGEQPVEMGMSNSVDEIMGRLEGDAAYQRLFHAAFPGDAAPFNLNNVVRGITCFTRTLISANAPYDRYRRGDAAAMSESAVRGMNDFFSEKFDCYHCHAGATFTVSFLSENSPASVPSFVDYGNTGLYNIGGTGAYPAPNEGLFGATGSAHDMGKFRIPTLRNVGVTAPYFHDGSAATLEDVLASYARGGRLIAGGPHAGDGAKNPFKDPLVRPIAMSHDEQTDMIAFLNGLTDTEFIDNPAHGSPTCHVQMPNCAQGSSYARDAAPILQGRCSHCHSAGGIAALLPLTDYNEAFALRDAILDQLSLCNMPPPAVTPLGDDERAALMTWARCGAQP